MRYGKVMGLALSAGFAGVVFAQCPGAPAVEADLGTLVSGVPVNTSTTFTTNEVHWFKFTLAAPVTMSSLTFLNFDTAGASADTEIGVYDCGGNLVATDDDDSTGLQSALSFGSGNAVQQGDATAVWSNGRDGMLGAGDYYLAAVRFNATFALTGWGVTSTATTGGTCPINVLLGAASALPDPAGTINLGTLALGGVVSRASESLSAGQVQWYRVTIPESSLALNQFVDMDTEGSVLAAANTTRLAVYNTTGAITGTLAPATRLNTTTGLTDATDGSDSLSQISLGAGTRAAVGNGLTYNGRDGNLQAGTYLIGVAGPGTAPSGTTAAGGNFGFVSTSANTGPITLNLRAGIATVALTVTGNAVTAQETTAALLRATVGPGFPPASTGIAVTGDLSAIGGSSAQTFYDDGTHGDVAAGDNIFSYSYTLPVSVPAAAYSVPVHAADAQSRTASGSIALTVSNGPSGACCTAGACSLSRQTLCAAGGGAWQGNGSSCGFGYTMTAGTNPFIDISATGTLLTTISNADDSTQAQALPFTFIHLGNAYTSVNVSSNGNIQFGASNSTQYANVTIPNAAVPNNMLAPLWDDFDMTDARNGPGIGSCFFLDDSATNNRVIISWQGVGQYNTANPVVDSNDFQVILYSNGNVEFRYGNVPTILVPQIAGDTVTIGYEDDAGASGGEFPGASVGSGGMSISLTATSTNPCGPTCDTIDFNHDDLFPDTQDIDDFLAVFSGGACTNDPNCGDIDFNNDDLFPDTMDIDALLSVFSGGPCVV
ncbi:MAG: choice-of-anchor X domain-containing protein [Phycisphaerales bacterium]